MVTRKIRLSNGKSTLVDEDDFAVYDRYTYHMHSKGYAYRWIDYPKAISLHREIMNCPPHMEVDHINGDGLDNRKHNLRVVTSSMNKHNRTERARGYYYETARGKWYACINVEGKKIFLGRFDTEEQAAIARREAEVKYLPEIFGVQDDENGDDNDEQKS
jgi:HNH endonuclease